MNSDILFLEDLKVITEYKNVGDVARCLRNQGIKFFHGKQGTIWTTMQLINNAGGIPSAPDASNETMDF